MKILIIENDFITCNYLRDLFGYSGYNVITANNAPEGLDVYNSERPNVVICNVLLPGMSGLEFLKTIRKSDKKTTIIMTATVSSEHLAVKAFRLGANDFFKKPIQDKDILPILQNLNSQINEKNVPDDCGNIEEGKMVLKFKTKYEAPQLIVRRLIDEIDDKMFDEGDIINIELGLLELITNAVEHGNLNISYKDKTEALDTNSLTELYQTRLQNPLYSKRLVTVTYEYNTNECRWTIADEGDGFNVSAVPDPTAPNNLEELHGRGIFMTRFFFDSLEYLGVGNKAVAVKKRKFLI